MAIYRVSICFTNTSPHHLALAPALSKSPQTESLQNRYGTYEIFLISNECDFSSENLMCFCGMLSHLNRKIGISLI